MYHPQMLRGLVAMNAPHPGVFFRELDFAQGLRMFYVALAQIPLLPEAILRATAGRPFMWSMRYLAGPHDPFPEEVLAVYRRMWFKPGVLTSMLNYYRAALFGTPPLWKGNRRVQVPGLMIWGRKDPVLGDDRFTEDLTPWVEEVRVRDVKDAGHWVQQERPGVVNELVRSFLISRGLG